MIRGKYIYKDATGYADALEGTRHCAALAVEQGSNETLALVPCQPSAPQWRPVTLQIEPKTSEEHPHGHNSNGAERDSSLPLQVATRIVNTSTDGHTSVEAKDDVLVQLELQTAVAPIDSQPCSDTHGDKSPQVVRQINAGRSRFAISDEQKNSRSFQPETRSIGLLTDSQSVNDDEDDEDEFEVPGPEEDDDVVFGYTVETQDVTKLRIPLSRLSIVDEINPETQDVTELRDLLSRLSIAFHSGRTVSKKEWASARKETLRSPRYHSPKHTPKAQRLAMCPINRPERSHIDKIRVVRLMTEKRTRKLQSLATQRAAADSGVDIGGGMDGVRVEGQGHSDDRPLLGGNSMEYLGSQQKRAGSAVEAGGMLSLEVQAQVTEGDEAVKVDHVTQGSGVEDEAGDGDEELADAGAAETEQADNNDEVMIGSDVEAAMEVDDETAKSSGDSGVIDEDSMKLEADGPRFEANEAGNPESMEIEPRCDRGKFNKEKLQDRIGRERAEFALRQASINWVSSREMVLASADTSAQSSQQHPTPVSTLETEDADSSILQGIAQHLVSTNSAADLREARLGKRPESRTVPAEVSGPSPSSRLPLTDDGKVPFPTQSMSPPRSSPPTTVSQERLPKGDGDTSDTTLSTPTPASTSPSSVSPTPPASPLPRNPASTTRSPKPASVRPEASAPEKPRHKRGCDSADDEDPHGEAKKTKPDQENRCPPSPAPPPLPPARKVLQTKPATRKPRGNGTHNSLNSPASGPSTASQPMPIHPPESSKRVQQQRPGSAKADDEIVPLNDIPDKTLTDKEILAQYADAAMAFWESDDEGEGEDGCGEG